jgi:transposase InsO family protein
MPMPKDLPSSPQQHGNRIRSAFYIRTTQLPSGHTNAMAESFFGALKNEWLNRMIFATRAQARQEVVKYIEGFYNQQRLHSGLGYKTPLEVYNEYLNGQLAA